MSILSASKICMLAPLACLLVACSVDAEPEPAKDPQGVAETAETAKTAKTDETERTGTATSAIGTDQCCSWVYDRFICEPIPPNGCPANGPTPTPTFY